MPESLPPTLCHPTLKHSGYRLHQSPQQYLVHLPCLQACIEVVPSNPANFNVDNVRVVKIPGGGAADARVVRGLLVKRGAEGAVQGVADAKVAVFAQGVDTSSTETKASAPLNPGPAFDDPVIHFAQSVDNSPMEKRPHTAPSM